MFVMTASQFREMFPFFGSRDIVYFDNAATSQRPESVVEYTTEASVRHNANIHRAVHALSAEATDAYEAGREAVRSFIGAASREEIIFTAGATSALNTVAYSFGEKYVHEGDEIIVGISEHHSNFVPWQLLAGRKGAKVVYLDITAQGGYDPKALESLITSRTRIVCVGHASNVLGILNPVEELAAVCHAHGVPIVVDGAQAVVHRRVDVQKLDCDFYAFSAHKTFGPVGVGVLYGKKSLLEEMPPFLSGGEMVGTVSTEGTDFAPLPAKFEAGTPNFTGVAAMVPALELSALALSDKELNAALDDVAQYMTEALERIDALKLYGGPSCGSAPSADRLPIFSFTIEGVHHEDLAILLDKMGIAVRSGQMCAEPLMTRLGVTGTVRASLLQYNTMEEAEKFIKCLEKAVRMLK